MSNATSSPWRHLQLNGRFVVAGSDVIGLWNPTNLRGGDGNGRVFVAGPRGVAQLAAAASLGEEVVELIATGALLLASEPGSARSVAALLDDPTTSRTTSYICCKAGSCEEVLEATRRLKQSAVAIFGCGGIGSIAAVTLAGLGVGRLRLIDPDVIELSNLNRQLFWRRQDVGRAKVAQLRSVILARFANVVVEERTEKVVSPAQAAAHLDGIDAVLFSADEPLGISRRMQEMCEHSFAYMVFAGYTNGGRGILKWRRGTAAPGQATPGQAAADSDGIKWCCEQTTIIPSYGPLNAEIAGHAAALIASGITGQIEPEHANGDVSFDSSLFPRALSVRRQTGDRP